MKITKESDRYVLDGSNTYMLTKNEVCMKFEGFTEEDNSFTPMLFRHFHIHGVCNLKLINKIKLLWRLWKWMK